MGQFAAALKNAMEDVGWRQVDLVNNTQAVTQPQLSRYLSSDDLPKKGTLEAICRHLPERVREDVTAAYLTDSIPPSSVSLVAVTSIREGPEAKPKYVPGKAPPGSILREDLDILEREALSNPNLAKAINFWASSLVSKPPASAYYAQEESLEEWRAKEDPAVIAAQQSLEQSASKKPKRKAQKTSQDSA